MYILLRYYLQSSYKLQRGVGRGLGWSGKGSGTHEGRLGAKQLSVVKEILVFVRVLDTLQRTIRGGRRERGEGEGREMKGDRSDVYLASSRRTHVRAVLSRIDLGQDGVQQSAYNSITIIMFSPIILLLPLPLSPPLSLSLLSSFFLPPCVPKESIRFETHLHEAVEEVSVLGI